MHAPTNLVLVTGSTGWLGKRFVRLLSRREFDHDALRDFPSDMRIRCLILPGEGDLALRDIGPQIEVMVGDVRNPTECSLFLEGAREALLFHTAGVIHPRRVKDFYSINVEGTRNLLAAAVEAGVRQVVVVSSNSPIGCNPHPDHLFDESSSYNPYMNYGLSKMKMELAVKQIEKDGNWRALSCDRLGFMDPINPCARHSSFL